MRNLSEAADSLVTFAFGEMFRKIFVRNRTETIFANDHNQPNLQNGLEILFASKGRNLKHPTKNKKMKIKSLTTILTLVFALLLQACAGANLDPKEFIEEAARGGMGETQMSRIALQRSQNPEIKSFAEEMIGSHSKIDVELAGVAGKKGVTLPRETSSTQKSTASKLEALNGEAFDKEFVNALIKDHENTIKLFQTHASNSPDADIKAFAVANLPKFQEHLQHAQNLKAKMPQ